MRCSTTGTVARHRPLPADPVRRPARHRGAGARGRRGARRQPPARAGTGPVPRLVREPVDPRHGRPSRSPTSRAAGASSLPLAAREQLELGFTIAVTLFVVAALATLRPERVDAVLIVGGLRRAADLPDAVHPVRRRLRPARVRDRPARRPSQLRRSYRVVRPGCARSARTGPLAAKALRPGGARALPAAEHALHGCVGRGHHLLGILRRSGQPDVRPLPARAVSHGRELLRVGGQRVRQAVDVVVARCRA